MARRSRLSKKFEKRSKETLVLSIAAIVVLSIILLKYGIPFISDLSFGLGQVSNTITGGKDEDKKKEVDSFVPVPQLDPVPKATKTDSVKLSGTSLAGLEIALFVNGSKDDSTKVNEDGGFSFEVSLSEGSNIIKVKAIRGDKESEFSESLDILYKKTNPSLTIDSPHDGDKFSKESNPVSVSGKTDPDVTVLINGFQAIISGEGNYSYPLNLNGGDNEIKVVATDLAGNSTEKSIKVNYSQ